MTRWAAFTYEELDTIRDAVEAASGRRDSSIFGKNAALRRELSKEIHARRQQLDPNVYDSMGRPYNVISHSLGIPRDGSEHMPFCTLPPNHAPGCGVTASGAMHPESAAAKRYRETRR